MKTFIKPEGLSAEQAEKNNFLMQKDTHATIVILIMGLLLLFALSTMAQTSGTMKAIRYGKEVTLTKDVAASIADVSAYYENGDVHLIWRAKNISESGVCVVMASDDGINYAYSYFIPTSKETKGFQYKIDSENKKAFYRVLFISNDNKYVLSERKYFSIYYPVSPI